MPTFYVHIGYTLDEVVAARYFMSDGFVHFLDEDDNLLASFAATQVSRIEQEGIVRDAGRVELRPANHETLQ
jgi:hypothetical protein